MFSAAFEEKIKKQVKGNRKVSFLVGAGLSAESGIPTFRDVDGYWTIGSKNYTPQEMGTLKMFNVNANQVWNWYLNRIQICRKAKPNKGHFALADIQRIFPDRFALISQNVDGLHFQTDMNEEQLYLIHGDLSLMRCSEACTADLLPIPELLLKRGMQENLTYEETQLVICPNCGDLCRPHVLWFDEYYNEKYYKLDTVLRIAKGTGLLFVVGTSGATNLPKKILTSVFSKNGLVVDINPKENLFTKNIKTAKNGYWIKGESGAILPKLKELLEKLNG